MEDFCFSYKALICTAVLCSLLPLVVGKPDGPPQAACGNLRPGTEQGAFELIGHTSLPQNVMYGRRPAPYTVRLLNVNVSTYQPNQDITVAVVANQTTGRRRYKGVMMQAFHVSCASRDRSVVLVEGPPLGQFRQIGTNKESLLAPMTCHGDQDNTLAHFSPQWKIKEKAIWTVPGGLEGHIVFRATIVQDVNIYWTERHSRILRDPRGGDVSKCAATCSYTNHLLLLIGVASYLLARKSN